MKKLLLLLLAITACSYFGAKAQNANKPHVYCLVLDKTYSMVGYPGSTYIPEADIWNEVQKYCYKWIDNIPESSIVLLYTYDENLYGPDTFSINSDVDKEEVKNAIPNKKSINGNLTYIGRNLSKIIKYLDDKYSDNEKDIYLITDGVEEDKTIKFWNVLNNYDGRLFDNGYLYYVDLNNKADNNAKEAANNNSHIYIGTGFATFITICPVFDTIPHEIKQDKQEERNFSVTQLFTVTKGPWVDGLTITADIPDNSVPNVNLNIDKSKAEMKNGKYEVEFVVEVVSNTNMPECIIPVNIMGSEIQKAGNTVQLNVEPSSFNIKVTKEHIEPIVREPQKIETSGWD